MSTTQHTGHYNLPTFGDNPNDRPSWRGDFTDAMTKIDDQMYANATNVTTATAAANNAKVAADAAKESADDAAELAQTNRTDVAKLDGYFGKLGVTSAQTAQNLMDAINGKAEDTDLAALQNTVSSLSGRVDGKADSSSVYTKAQADTTFTKQGGYAGTAQTIYNTASQAAAQLQDLMTSGQAATLVGSGEVDHKGLRIQWTAYYSHVARLVTVRVNASGAITGGINAEADKVELGTLDAQYRPTVDLRTVIDVVNEGPTFLTVKADTGKVRVDFNINSSTSPFYVTLIGLVPFFVVG
jgi:hypothetical protein